MEKLPYREELDSEPVASSDPLAELEPGPNDWRTGLPEVAGSVVTLRELRTSDAASLFAAMANDEVTRFISPPPATIDGFERFIAWTHRQRTAGQSASFAIVARGADVAIGLFQVRALDMDFVTAEWGFAIASEFWGTGMFIDGAQLILEFAFDVVGVHRLEARSAVTNTRGTSALRKLGAVHEGVLRKSFLRHGEFQDQSLWTLLADDWRDARTPCASRVIH
jgi:ribosomal-protein-alanine N-acetyltransferase